jgi:putative component of membrane protein insertase Oxa1/YidC/SpoIIIJ protein YidD
MITLISLFFLTTISFTQYDEEIITLLPKQIEIQNDKNYSFKKVLHKTYQTLLSQHDPARCEFSPSCSSFAIKSLNYHGIIKGILLSGDRLMRSGYTGIYLKEDGSFIDLVTSY